MQTENGKDLVKKKQSFKDKFSMFVMSQWKKMNIRRLLETEYCMCLMEVIVSDVRNLRMGLKLMPQNSFKEGTKKPTHSLPYMQKNYVKKFAGKVIRHRCSYHTDCFGWPSIGLECYSGLWLWKYQEIHQYIWYC